MTYDEVRKIVLDLPFDTMTQVYNNGEQAILIYRPSTLPERFKNYDVNTNFQIFLKKDWQAMKELLSSGSQTEDNYEI